MTIFEKLAKARTEFAKRGVQKSGINMHAEFKYYELEDIVPVAREIFDELKVLFVITFDETYAIGTLIDLEKTDSRIPIMVAMTHIAEPAKFRMNEVQALGAETTYLRRYLYMLLLDITEPDAFDGESGKKEAPAPKKPVSKEERQQIKEELTAPAAQAQEMQITALKNACKALLEKDPTKEDFVQQIAVKTKGFTAITKEQAEALINGINEMLGD